jgi:hypothetical protein
MIETAMPRLELWTAVAKHIGVGLGLFYGVIKLFDTIGDRLNEDTKLEISLWLLDVRTEKSITSWPSTVSIFFDRVFTARPLSFRGFLRSALITGVALLANVGILTAFRPELGSFFLRHDMLFPSFWAANLLPDYASLLATRYMLSRKGRWNWRFFPSFRLSRQKREWIALLLTLRSLRLSRLLKWFDRAMVRSGLSLLLLCDLSLNLVLAEIGALGGIELYGACQRVLQSRVVSSQSVNELLALTTVLEQVVLDLNLFVLTLVPASIASIWVLLYVGSGSLIRVGRTFDVLQKWTNAHMNIEEKPLQCIGMVAAGLVALAYWTTAIIASVTSSLYHRASL